MIVIKSSCDKLVVLQVRNFTNFYEHANEVFKYMSSQIFKWDVKSKVKGEYNSIVRRLKAALVLNQNELSLVHFVRTNALQTCVKTSNSCTVSS